MSSTCLPNIQTHHGHSNVPYTDISSSLRYIDSQSLEQKLTRITINHDHSTTSGGNSKSAKCGIYTVSTMWRIKFSHLNSLFLFFFSFFQLGSYFLYCILFFCIFHWQIHFPEILLFTVHLIFASV